MPYKSAKQRAYMHIHLPKVAAEWDAETGGKIVPGKRQRPTKPSVYQGEREARRRRK
jgi:hypothetical protein